MYIFGIIQLSESSIRLDYPDYPTSNGYYPSLYEFDIRIKYPNSYPISEKMSGYPKIISE